MYYCYSNAQSCLFLIVGTVFLQYYAVVDNLVYCLILSFCYVNFKYLNIRLYSRSYIVSIVCICISISA